MNKITPMGYKVLVKPIEVDETTEGGIIIKAAETKEKEEFAQEQAIFVRAGSLAFREPQWLEIPSAGTKVVFKKYAGIVVKGTDGEKYRLMEDNDNGAVIEG